MRRRQALKILGDVLDHRYGRLGYSHATLGRAFSRFGVVALRRGDGGRVMGEKPDGTLLDLAQGFEVREAECCGVKRLIGYPGNGCCPVCKKVRFFVPRAKDLDGDYEVFVLNATTVPKRRKLT